MNGGEYAGVVDLTGTFARPAALFKIIKGIGGKPIVELHPLHRERHTSAGVPEDRQFTLPFSNPVSQKGHLPIF